MKITEQEERFLDIFRKVGSEKSKNDLLFQAEIIVRAQEDLIADYGLKLSIGSL